MKSIYQLEKNRSRALQKYYSTEKQLEAKKKKIEKEIEDLKYPHLKDYLNKLGKAVLPKIPGATYFEVLGPFGIGAECSIYFSKKIKDKEITLAGATFTHAGDSIMLKDYSKKTNEFKKGTIGEVNGMNYEYLEITPEMTIDWFVKFAIRKENI